MKPDVPLHAVAWCARCDTPFDPSRPEACAFCELSFVSIPPPPPSLADKVLAHMQSALDSFGGA